MSSVDSKEVQARSGNQHVLEFLDYFISFPRAPRYAVLLNGPWGAGKSYLVRRFLNDRFKDRKEFVFVSLYGLKDSDAIDAALFQALYPVLGWKGNGAQAPQAQLALRT